MNFLKKLPQQPELLSWAQKNTNTQALNVNAHIHTPYSFSCFDNIEQPFEMAKRENISVLGINDFFVTDGFEAFHNTAVKNKVFPLFNAEFICLLKEEQEQGVRINDPNNPGRIYFTAKGLNFPFQLPLGEMKKLNNVITESQNQVMAMINKVNLLFKNINAPIILNYNTIKSLYAKQLVRERHIAKAIRIAIFDITKTDNERITLFKLIFGGKDLKAQITDIAGIDNEIRGNLLKAGGAAFVAEEESAFLPLNTIIEIITKGGGIPCYPTLLDDAKGAFTEYEADFEKLFTELTNRNIWCIELIPNRNNIDILKRFVNFFNNKGFVVLLGTEHNAPELIPLTVETRGAVPIDDELKNISYQGACVIAAHQYLQANGQIGYVNLNGIPNYTNRNQFIELGNAVIKYFINN